MKYLKLVSYLWKKHQPNTSRLEKKAEVRGIAKVEMKSILSKTQKKYI